MTKPYNRDTIDLFLRSILDDEFDDTSQNKDAYDNKISGQDTLTKLIELSPIRQQYDRVLDVGSGASYLAALFPDKELYVLEPCPGRQPAVTKERPILRIQGWCENIRTSMVFDAIVCWGVIHFARSVPETLIEFNKSLPKSGVLILDVAEYTTMPLIQTTNPDCFARYAQLFGFELEARSTFTFGNPYYLKRVGMRFRKTREFDPAYLRMPQSMGKINNYLPERDWYLRGGHSE